MTPQGRPGGYAPIGDYAVLGDGRTTALAASDGRIDWWAIPALDAPPVCAAILDPDGGGTFILGAGGPRRREPAVPARHQRAGNHLRHPGRDRAGDGLPERRRGGPAAVDRAGPAGGRADRRGGHAVGVPAGGQVRPGPALGDPPRAGPGRDRRRPEHRPCRAGWRDRPGRRPSRRRHPARPAGPSRRGHCLPRTPLAGGRRPPTSAAGCRLTAGRRPSSRTRSTPAPTTWTLRSCWRAGPASTVARGSPAPSTPSSPSSAADPSCTATRGWTARRTRSSRAHSGWSKPWPGQARASGPGT